MTLRSRLWLLTVATYATVALAALALALSLMSAAQALGVQSWRTGNWWTFLLPDGGGMAFLITTVGTLQGLFRHFRTRAAWRLAALNGNPEAMPLALPALVLGGDEKVDDTPISAPVAFRWGLTDRGRIMRLLPWNIYALILIGLAALLLWVQVAVISPLTMPGDLGNLFLPALALALICVSLVALGVALRSGLRRPEGVIADTAGIGQWTPHGPGAMIPWREARLLEATWFGIARKKVVPYLHVYRSDGTSIRWPVFSPPRPGEAWRYQALDMSGDEAAATSRALVRLAVGGSGAPVRTANRSLADTRYTWEQEAGEVVKEGPGHLYLALFVAAVGIGALAFRGIGAPWLNDAASVGLALCAARLAYFYARDALVIPNSWETKGGDRPRGTLRWPALMAMSGAGALVASISALVAGHAPASGWTDTEVIGGSALMLLSGALIFWARTGASKRASAASMRA
jgi:hypothetical protein